VRGCPCVSMHFVTSRQHPVAAPNIVGQCSPATLSAHVVPARHSSSARLSRHQKPDRNRADRQPQANRRHCSRTCAPWVKRSAGARKGIGLLPASRLAEGRKIDDIRCDVYRRLDDLYHHRGNARRIPTSARPITRHRLLATGTASFVVESFAGARSMWRAGRNNGR
jgi:hypothetical protein